MKKIICVLLLMLLSAVPVLAQDDITVIINGSKLISDVGGQVVNQRTMVPLRAVAETLEAKVTWRNETQGIVIEKGGRRVDITIGSQSASITQDNRVTSGYLDAAPYIRDGRTMVPLRFIAQSLESRVFWSQSMNTAVITDDRRTVPEATDALAERYFSSLMPQLIQSEGSRIAADIEGNPDAVIANLSNMWVDEAAALLAEKMTQDECGEFGRLASDKEKQYEFLLQMGEKYGVALECPIRICLLENGSAKGILLDGPGKKNVDIAHICVLRSVNDKIVCENLE